VNAHDLQRAIGALETKHAEPYQRAIEALLSALATKNQIGASIARRQLEDLTIETMGVAEVIGAGELLRRAASVLIEDQSLSRAVFARSWPLDLRSLIVFRESGFGLAAVTLQEAIDEMIARTPVTLRDASERAGERIRRLYSERRVVGFAKAIEHSVTERVQSLLIQALREGLVEGGAARTITAEVARLQTKEWTEAYSRMVFRTNVNTAVTAGRFRQAQDPDIRKVIPCFRFDAVGDGDTRTNHRAADGIILRVDNPEWNRIAPPLGYNCRCQVSLMSTPMLKRMGRIDADGNVVESRIPPGAAPDMGFRHGGRPDLFVGAT